MLRRRRTPRASPARACPPPPSAPRSPSTLRRCAAPYRWRLTLPWPERPGHRRRPWPWRRRGPPARAPAPPRGRPRSAGRPDRGPARPRCWPAAAGEREPHRRRAWPWPWPWRACGAVKQGSSLPLPLSLFR
jgi:hypothetical protein